MRCNLSERLQFKTLGELAAAAEEHMLDPIGRNLGIAVGSEYAILFVDGSTSATIVPLVESAPRDRSRLLKIGLDQGTPVRL